MLGRVTGTTGMLDYFCIFSKGGALLWTWQLTALRGSPVEALIRTCLLEERSGEKSFTYKPPVGAAYTLKWTLDNVSPVLAGFLQSQIQLGASLVLCVSAFYKWPASSGTFPLEVVFAACTYNYIICAEPGSGVRGSVSERAQAAVCGQAPGPREGAVRRAVHAQKV